MFQFTCCTLCVFQSYTPCHIPSPAVQHRPHSMWIFTCCKMCTFMHCASYIFYALCTMATIFLDLQHPSWSLIDHFPVFLPQPLTYKPPHGWRLGYHGCHLQSHNIWFWAWWQDYLQPQSCPGMCPNFDPSSPCLIVCFSNSPGWPSQLCTQEVSLLSCRWTASVPEESLNSSRL